MDKRPLLKTLLAFGIIYIVWGSTFLAIRVGVQEMPPLLMAAMRFGAAGLLLFAWARMRGEKPPVGRQWLGVTVLAALMFMCDYGLLFWAETRVPSGIAAVLLATIPAFIAIAEALLLRTRKFTVGLGVSLLVGLAGVAILMVKSVGLGGEAVSGAGAAALIVAAASWSVATVLTRRLPLPESKMVSSGAQMLVGGLLLFGAATVFGEWPRFHPAAVSMHAWEALIYLIVAGSIVGYTAYLWLLHRESPTRVGTYAYVNPVVAVAVGHWLGGEELATRTIVGTALVLASVLAIMLVQGKASEPERELSGEPASEEIGS
ncbi:MAG TPA: EamA family transporter [Terracidiphilus sp.]|jgi:drug/metabolite transporter (DMT)-like permease